MMRRYFANGQRGRQSKEMQIGKWVVMKIADVPAWDRATELARSLSQNDIEALLAGKVHIHKNPKKKLLNNETPVFKAKFVEVKCPVSVVDP
ncbi:MAG: hypothetical protein KKD18_03040, partial [Nanoarchaeota archaeon]|nr:hypothetical protein [Nanoarchaeota archaeon]